MKRVLAREVEIGKLKQGLVVQEFSILNNGSGEYGHIVGFHEHYKDHSLMLVIDFPSYELTDGSVSCKRRILHLECVYVFIED